MMQPSAFPGIDYLSLYEKQLRVEEIALLRKEREAWLWSEQVRAYRDAVQSVDDVASNFLDLSDDVVKIGQGHELSQDQNIRWEQAVRTFCPWKKGPFSLFGVSIDAEWRSDWKWNRILPHIQPLDHRKVADIGCHNGYFMFRMANQHPALVVGFEPYAKHYWNFQLMQRVARLDNVAFELLGVEHIDLYPQFYDTIFCLGILYHHSDPIGLLRKMNHALAPEGELVIDCQGIPGDSPVALTPRGRYANARGIWFLPTQSCLEHWMIRAGLTRIRCIYAEPLSPSEQRTTPWADIQSLQDFLDPHDSSRTMEGYPAPWRYYIIAQKGT